MLERICRGASKINWGLCMISRIHDGRYKELFLIFYSSQVSREIGPLQRKSAQDVLDEALYMITSVRAREVLVAAV